MSKLYNPRRGIGVLVIMAGRNYCCANAKRHRASLRRAVEHGRRKRYVVYRRLTAITA